jgi:hypothetical protein
MAGIRIEAPGELFKLRPSESTPGSMYGVGCAAELAGTPTYSPWEFLSRDLGELKMQAAIDRVMQTYAMMVNLTPEKEAEARERSPPF